MKFSRKKGSRSSLLRYYVKVSRSKGDCCSSTGCRFYGSIYVFLRKCVKQQKKKRKEKKFSPQQRQLTKCRVLNTRRPFRKPISIFPRQIKSLPHFHEAPPIPSWLRTQVFGGITILERSLEQRMVRPDHLYQSTVSRSLLAFNQRNNEQRSSRKS